LLAGIKESGFAFRGVIESPIKGATSGNTEYVAYFAREPSPGNSAVAEDMETGNKATDIS